VSERAGLFGLSGEQAGHVRIEHRRPRIIAPLPADMIGTADGPDPSRSLAYWTIPVEHAPRSGDLICWRELAWRIHRRCAHRHPAWQLYARWAWDRAAEQGTDPVTTVAGHEVWSSLRLSPDDLRRLGDGPER
jgi:hypothetical protein